MVNQGVGSGRTIQRNRNVTSGPTTETAQPAQQVADTARQTVSKATETAKQQADNQRQKVSGGLDRVAQTLHETGDNLRQNQQGMLGEYIEKAATKVEQASGYLNERSVDQIISDVESYARREPAILLGVAVGIGFLAARLIKASTGRATSGLRGQTLRYTTPAYTADRDMPVVGPAYETRPGVASRYGNGPQV